MFPHNGAFFKTKPSRVDCGLPAVGRIDMENTGADHNTILCHTYHMQQFGEVIQTGEQSDSLNATLKRFWYLETMGITPLRPLMISTA